MKLHIFLFNGDTCFYSSVEKNVGHIVNAALLKRVL